MSLDTKRAFREDATARLENEERYVIRLAENIKRVRLDADMSIEDAALALGMTSIQLERTETRANGLRVETLLRMSELYNKPIAALLPNMGKQSNRP